MMALETWRKLQESEGKYILINALSRRIRGLHTGDKPLVNRPFTDLAVLAAEEIQQKKLKIRRVDPKLRKKDSTAEADAKDE